MKKIQREINRIDDIITISKMVGLHGGTVMSEQELKKQLLLFHEEVKAISENRILALVESALEDYFLTQNPLPNHRVIMGYIRECLKNGE